MNDKTITALAREYAEFTDMSPVDKKNISAICECFLKYTLRRYCLVEKSKAMQLYSHLLDLVENERISEHYSEWCDHEREYIALFGENVFADYFGSKCLPDAHEDNFTRTEPKPSEPKNEGTRQEQYVPKNAESGTHSLNHILKDGFREHNRLHIAAMAMQGLISKTPRFSSYEISNLVRISLDCADALIKKAEGGSDGED